MATKLKGLEVGKVDFVDEGANQRADIKLLKGKNKAEETSDPEIGLFKRFLNWISGEVQKSATTFDEQINAVSMDAIRDEIWSVCYALQNSLNSILCDPELDSSGKQSAMDTSIEQFATAMKEYIPGWAGGTSAKIKKNLDAPDETDLPMVMKAHTQNALSTMYESMKPDVTQMQGLIDDYREAGKAVPQSLMDSFNDAIEVGAAAGDTSATWQNYANQIWKNGSDELKASLTDPSNPMYETVRSQLPPELAEAIDRAAAETTTDDVTLEGLKASVDGDVDIDKDAWTSKLNEALGDLGETQEVTADHVKIKVDQGDCLWEIGNALGIDWQTIAEQNGIESPYIIHPDQELTISMDTLTAEVDGDKAQAAIEQAMSALDAEGAEMSVTAEGVKVDLADVEVDSDTAAAQIEAALGMESGTLAANGIEVQAGASVTIPSELVEAHRG